MSRLFMKPQYLTLWDWCKNRQTDHWKNIANPHKRATGYYKGDTAELWRKGVFITNGSVMKSCSYKNSDKLY